MARKPFEQPKQVNDLLQHLGPEAGRGRFSGEALDGVPHRTCSQVRFNILSGTIRFHDFARRAGSRVERSR